MSSIGRKTIGLCFLTLIQLTVLTLLLTSGSLAGPGDVYYPCYWLPRPGGGQCSGACDITGIQGGTLPTLTQDCHCQWIDGIGNPHQTVCIAI